MSTTANPTAPPVFISEQLASHLRDGDYESVANLSPYAACLMPLLSALGWRSFEREIIEALPHFSERLRLGELRNMLASLGYESDRHDARPHTIDPSLLPCLFVSTRGDVFVLNDRRDGELVYFDAATGEHRRGPLTHRGTAYVFTETAVTEAPRGPWFGRLVRRFKSLVRHLLAMTLVLNLITMLVPLFIMVMYDRVIGAKSLDALPFMAGGMVFALSIELGMRLLRARTLGLLAGRLDYLISVETFRQIVHLPPQFTERSSVATQISTLKQFDAIRDFFTGPTAALVLEAPFVVLFIALIWLLGGWIAIVPVVMIGLYFGFAALWLPGMNRQVARAGAARTNRQHLLLETLSGLRELKSLGAEKVWATRIREMSADTLDALYRTSIGQAILDGVTYTLTTLAGIAVLGLGALQVLSGDMTVGALIAVLALVWRVLAPLQGLFLAYVKFDQIAQGIRTLNQLMQLETENVGGNAASLAPKVQGALRFDRVSYRYTPRSDPALLGVSFDVRPGEFIAVLGPNGSGKSTILKLLAGMYFGQAGSVLVDDGDTRQFNPMDLRRSVAYVPQSPTVFHGTIAQNLRLKDAMATDADLELAADEAGILETIRALPKGFDTPVGDASSVRLPSGFLHGLCLARAFLSDSRVILLDEPGSTLDREGDIHLMTQLERLKGKRTVVMVSHRPSHIRMADRAVLLDRGTVKFVGKPSEALAIVASHVQTLSAVRERP